MLRRIQDDLTGKSYARKAREEIHENPRMLANIRASVRERNREAAEAITSVIESRGTAIIKVESRAAMAELFRVKDTILRELRAHGIEQLRFRV